MRTTSTLSGGDFLLTARSQGIFQSQPFLLHAAEQSLQATYSESHRKFQRVTRFYRSQDQSLQRIVSVWRPAPLLWTLLLLGAFTNIHGRVSIGIDRWAQALIPRKIQPAAGF